MKSRVPAWFFVVGLLVYGADLGHPPVPVFDEVHYLTAAKRFAQGEWMNPEWTDGRPQNWEHPPLAKYVVAGALRLFGERPIVYRVPSVVLGALGLAGLALLGERLFRSSVAGALAATLMLLDPIGYVHARLFLLEVYVATAVLWAFALSLGRRERDRWMAGVALALALSSKLTALFALPMLFVILAWRDFVSEPAGRTTRWLARDTFIVLGIPMMVFALLQWPFLSIWAREGGWIHAIGHDLWVLGQSFQWGSAGPMTHAEAAPPIGWLPLLRPTWYYGVWGSGEGEAQLLSTIYAIGNPVVWWGAPAIAVAVLWGPCRRLFAALRATSADRSGHVALRIALDDWQRLTRMGLAITIFCCCYAPFFLLRRLTFFYYMSLLAPYLALIAGGGLSILLGGSADVDLTQPRSSRRIASRAFVAAYVVAAAAVAVWWFPLYTGYTFDRGTIDRAWHLVPWMTRLIP